MATTLRQVPSEAAYHQDASTLSNHSLPCPLQELSCYKVEFSGNALIRLVGYQERSEHSLFVGLS